MSTVRSRVSTAIGLLTFLGGIVVVAMAIPTRRGIGYELVLGSEAAVPVWAFALSFVGGPLLVLGGAVFGMRYGHFERYHEDYDPETGEIDSNHPFARLQRWASKSDPSADTGEHPEKFVMTRTHLAVLVGVLTWGPLTYLLVSVSLLSPMIRWMIVVILGGGGVVTFVYVDYVLRSTDSSQYDPSW